MSELKVNTISSFNGTQVILNSPLQVNSGDIVSANNVLIGNKSMVGVSDSAATSKYYVDQQFAARGLSSGAVGVTQIQLNTALATERTTSDATYVKIADPTSVGQTVTTGLTFANSNGYAFGSAGNTLNIKTSSGLVGVGTTAPSQTLHVVGTLGVAHSTFPTTVSTVSNDSSNNLTVNGFNRVNLNVASSNKIQIDPNLITASTNVTMSAALTAAGLIRFSNTTDSSSTTTGALVVSGGLGVAGTISSANLSTAAITGSGLIRFSNATDSSSTTTGALVVSGGVGVGGALYAANINSGTLNASSATNSTSTTTGALTVAGGVGVAGIIHSAGLSSSAILSCATAPTLGQHLTNKTYVDGQDIGAGQTWQPFTSTDRAVNTAYTNNTVKPIMVSVTCGSSQRLDPIMVSGITIANIVSTSTTTVPFSFIVPAGATYQCGGPGDAFMVWAELR